MNIDTKIPAVRNVVSKSLAGLLITGGVIFLSSLMNNFEVDPSPWALFFTICKWMTMFLLMIIYDLMAKEAYVNVMKWVDSKKIEPLDPIEPGQENAIN